ncbi:MAG: UDP-N-acetylglucosamine 2-epimerase (non-hydrolyzing) [Deltaproteobacteria bacterium]|nr:UDP-N-acetylglucosamine 2-epimerase (non-hydrolyzing) [Deltaproteobacteria bacterium]
MKIAHIAGARPNFIKVAPLLREMRRHAQLSPILIHTGQHYDVQMAGQFFQDLQIPKPDVSLEVGSGSHGFQTAEVMKRLEPVLEDIRPDLVLVVGDVNSTLAAALTAAKLLIPVAHVEAGLRSFDRSMPEEINRLVTDAVSEFLFVSEESGRENLLREGVNPGKIFFVGNVMIDSLMSCRPLWESLDISGRLGLRQREYGVVTLHRPSNVDAPGQLRALVESLANIAEELPLLLPMHPRTRARIKEFGLEEQFQYLSLDSATRARSPMLYGLEPMGYLDFMSLMADARIVLTDSGGLQEETTMLGVPCLTLRENTERPVTISSGTNRLIGVSSKRITSEARCVLATAPPVKPPPPLWDGRAAERIVTVLREHLLT